MKKQVIAVTLALLMMFSMVSTSFAVDTSFIKRIESTINEVIQNNTDNLKAIVSLGADLIKYTVGKFKDVKETDWFIKHISKLVGLKGIGGYPDGTIKPNSKITRAEYTTMLVKSMGYSSLETSTGAHWSLGFIKQAESLKILDGGEFSTSALDQTISRYEMAKMAARAIEVLGETQASDRADYSPAIADYNKIPSQYRDYVLMVYAKGIIKGYPDGNFKGENGLTRAEASVVIINTLFKEERVLPTKPSAPGQIKLGETKPLADILPKGNILNQYGMNITKVTLVDASKYNLTLHTGEADSVSIKINSKPGSLAYISANKIEATEGGYSLGSATYYPTERVDITKVEYLGFYNYGNEVMELIKNPFKGE